MPSTFQLLYLYLVDFNGKCREICMPCMDLMGVGMYDMGTMGTGNRVMRTFFGIPYS